MTLATILALVLTPQAGGVQWFTDLEGGLAEAKRTNRPIFLLSAAPNCSEVPGEW